MGSHIWPEQIPTKGGMAVDTLGHAELEWECAGRTHVTVFSNKWAIKKQPATDMLVAGPYNDQRQNFLHVDFTIPIGGFQEIVP